MRFKLKRCPKCRTKYAGRTCSGVRCVRDDVKRRNAARADLHQRIGGGA